MFIVSDASGAGKTAVCQYLVGVGTLTEVVVLVELTMPALAIGGDKSFGAGMADILRFVATDVTGVVIPNSGHWLMEEQPAATVAAIRAFLEKR